MNKQLLILGFFFYVLCASSASQAQTWSDLDSLARNSTSKGLYAKADTLLQKALELVRKEHGESSLATAQVYSSIGSNEFKKPDYKKALYHYLKTKEIRAVLLGKNSTEFARAAQNCGESYRQLGDITKAVVSFNEAKDAFMLTKGAESAELATVYNSLGMVHRGQGDFELAESYYLKAKAIREKTLGRLHQSYALTCNNLAALYQALGRYDRAELLYFEARDIVAQTVGTEHQEFARSCNNLGALYENMGRYSKSEEYYKEALRIRAKTQGKNHPAYAITLSNLAALYRNMKKLDEAAALLEESLKITEQIYGKEHTEYAGTLVNLAAIRLRKNELDLAESLLKEGMALIEKKIGTAHVLYATACQTMGNVYQKQGKHEKAEKLLLQALEIKSSRLGFAHPNVAEANLSLSTCYFQTKQGAKAAQYLREAIKSTQQYILTLLPTLSEQERLDFMKTVLLPFDQLASLAQHYALSEPSLAGDLYNGILFSKGLVFASTQKMRKSILASKDTALIASFEQWKSLRVQLSKYNEMSHAELLSKGVDTKKVENEVNALEKQLSLQSSLFAKNGQIKQYTWQELRDKLGPKSVAIEIKRFIEINADRQDTVYLALLLGAFSKDQPLLVRIPKSNELESKHISYYKSCVQLKKKDLSSYELFWKPIGRVLDSLSPKGFEKIYFSPEGVYHQLSLNTLYNTLNDKYLMDECAIQLVGSTRDLLEFDLKAKSLSKNFESYQSYLIGYPLYNLENSYVEESDERSASFSGVQNAMSSMHWPMLAGTKAEVEGIGKLFKKYKSKALALTGVEANEDTLKSLVNPYILHIATHGYFLKHAAENEPGDAKQAMEQFLSKNKLLRSGLVLAGCENPKPAKNDGFLTSEEAMNLSLDKTELVVLSACETGLGDLRLGEGVFGLQRAFQQAGAKSVIMSLWKVSDAATEALMKYFYEYLLKGKSKQEAFRLAQLKLRKSYDHHYYWGGFVLVGE